ncbi:ubiquinol-cytochrome C chaperone-domain-containing protein [Xylariaceae sp. FL0804]|nr:ubiquinol-cytochrome C chaperone-domain-containing protein [Xylariaceae sp. FL0804]
MACRSCWRQRQLTQLARQANTISELSNATTTAAAVAARPQQLRRPTTAPRATPAQKRGFHCSPSRLGLGDTLQSIVFRTLGPNTSHRVLGVSKPLYELCSRAAQYTIDPVAVQAGTVPKTADGEDVGKSQGPWHKVFDLPPTFSTWSQVTMLHMYVIVARTRNQEAEAARLWQSQLVDHFFFDAEEAMELRHGLGSRALRQRYLKELFIQWRGVLAAYDEGVARGDAALAAAVWRNVFKARPDADPRALAAVVAWVRRSLSRLDRVPDFQLPAGIAAVLRHPVAESFADVDPPAEELRDQLATRSNSSRPAPEGSPTPPTPPPIEKVPV